MFFHYVFSPCFFHYVFFTRLSGWKFTRFSGWGREFSLCFFHYVFFTRFSGWKFTRFSGWGRETSLCFFHYVFLTMLFSLCFFSLGYRAWSSLGFWCGGHGISLCSSLGLSLAFPLGSVSPGAPQLVACRPSEATEPRVAKFITGGRGGAVELFSRARGRARKQLNSYSSCNC